MKRFGVIVLLMLSFSLSAQIDTYSVKAFEYNIYRFVSNREEFINNLFVSKEKTDYSLFTYDQYFGQIFKKNIDC